MQIYNLYIYTYLYTCIMKTQGKRIWKYLIHPNAQRKLLPKFQLISALIEAQSYCLWKC